MNYAKDVTSEYTASYAKYVATSRAIPALTDGLKPVHRRCINSAHDLKLYHDKKFLKVAKLTGQVCGDYHPHGGASMTILAQPFKTRYPLFEGQGNWGSPDEPYSVAAERYIETRLTKFCEDFYLSSSDYADREDNYDGRLKEVIQYYPPIPGVMLTNASGIAVGLSTNIPPHRVSDVCKSILAYLKNPESSKYLEGLMPETCEESIILTPKKDIEKLYTTGECTIQYQAKTHYESIEGRQALVVDAFPPDYSKKRLETQFILDAVESGQLELRNESSTGIRYVFLSNDPEILKAVEERLYSSASYKMYIEHKGKIHLYKLNELYDDFIEDRKSYVVRKYEDLRAQVDAEEEYLRVWIEFKQNKEYIRTIFDRSREEVINHIIKEHNTIKDVAVRVISSSLSSMMKDGDIEKLEKKRLEMISKSKEYQSYVDNPLDKIILDIKALYKEYKNEERRAVHLEDVSDTVSFKYNGNEYEALPYDTFYVAKKNNTYELKSAAEIATMDLTDLILVTTDKDYYVFYDKQGLVVVTKDVMSRLSNKFNSNELVGIIATNDLSKIEVIRSNNKKTWALGDWAVRSRSSYVRQVDGDAYIKLSAQP